MQSVIDAIVIERHRQMDAEGWTAEHDDGHTDGSLALAACCYAHPTPTMLWPVDVPTEWPWADKWWKPKNRRRDLIRAAALIVAEIERLDRADRPSPPPGETTREEK